VPEHPPQPLTEPAPSEAAPPSLHPVEEIGRKISQSEFVRDDGRSSIQRGWTVGWIVGLILGVILVAVLALTELGDPRGWSELPEEAIALVLPVVGGIVACMWFCGLAGSFLVLVYHSLRPIVAAIFWSPEWYEREYGPELCQPPRAASPAASPSEIPRRS
jgi:hypothetical protein